ncbi:hypothetical protein Cmaq_0310 [Caldivirga maquilingensis IC-167]|uniref:Uncharacterized protein n=2 Tax=Caldivirga maquilingensis TaxID=76887 RepID=A8MB68_CALMQ|nr:hypothetical protein Cmaq_0310 [Caldivirga maquilingensis IC-167]
MRRLIAFLTAFIAMMPVLAAVPNYIVNYGLIYINGSSIPVMLPINGSSIIPLNCNGLVNLTLVIDPRSQLGLASASLVLSNGSITPVTGLNTPKYMSTWVNCRSTYGVIVFVSSYMKIPPVLYLYNGPVITGSYSGSGVLTINNTVSLGLTPLYTIIGLVVIGGSVKPASPFTFLVNKSTYTINTNGIPIVMNKYVYISYTLNPTFRVNNATVYYSVNTTYSIPATSSIPWSGLALLSNDTAYYTVSLTGSLMRLNATIPIFIPGQELVKLSGSVNWIESTASVSLNPWCSNLLIPTQVSGGNVIVTVPSNETLYVGNEPVVNLIVLGLANNKATVTLNNIITGSSISVETLDGYPLNATILLLGHGAYSVLRNNTCLVPGLYSMVIMSDSGYYRLVVNINQSSTIVKVPLFHVVNLSTTLTQLPPSCSNVMLTMNSSAHLISSNDNVFKFTLSNVKYGSSILINAVINGSIVGSSMIKVNSSEINVSIPVRVINVKVTGLLGSPISAVVDAGGLSFNINGSATICVPIGVNYVTVHAAIGSYTVPIVGNSASVNVLYYINWSYLAAILLIIVIIIIAALLAKLVSGGKNNDNGDFVITVGD